MQAGRSCDLDRVSDLISAIRDALLNGAEELHGSALDIPDDYLRRLKNDLHAFVKEYSESYKLERKAGAKA